MKDRRIVIAGFSLLLAMAGFHRGAFSQAPKGKGGAGGEAAALAEAYKGVTTDGNVVPGLFSIRSSSVSTEKVRRAAEAFLASLDEKQRQITMYPIDDPEWRKWNNIHRYTRQGICFKDMTDRQRELAFGMMGAALSAKGLKLTRDVMKLNGTLAELAKSDEYGEWLYNITVMGSPLDIAWGWQLDGHHGIVNYFVLGNQVVMTPTFIGGEPVKAEGGKFAGTEILKAEAAKGQALASSLTDQQKSKAVIQSAKTANNSLAQAFRDNLVLDYAGLAATELTAKQKEMLLDLVHEYVGNMDDGHARVKMEEVRRHLDKTYFAWVGKTGPEDVFYYRIQSPVVLIEFDHQTPVGLPGPREPGRLHIHTVIRTPNGNDYGKDLLRQHYERSHGIPVRKG